jgi:hypothetical protein
MMQLDAGILDVVSCKDAHMTTDFMLLSYASNKDKIS